MNSYPIDWERLYLMTKAITKGDAVTKLSMLVMGLGNLAHKQIVKGILFLAVEIAYLLFMICLLYTSQKSGRISGKLASGRN